MPGSSPRCGAISGCSPAVGEAGEYCLRPATLADMEPIAAIDASASVEAFSPTLAQRYCERAGGREALVCDSANEICGFAFYSMVLDEGSLDNIAVMPARQCRGIGARLLAAVLKAMRERGMSRCLLEVRASNHAARSLYSRHGFVEDGVRPGYYSSRDRREDAVLMSRRL